MTTRRILALVALSLFCSGLEASRLKDLARLRGARNNQLVGYGLVVGLPGTGDRSVELTEGSLGLALKGMGVDVKAKKLETQNAAAVVCTAELPPFARVGSRLDLTVASVGTATSLEGGALVLTALRGPDGKVYAMAQGRIVVAKSQNPVTGQSTSAPGTTASIPAGALVEKEVPFDFSAERELRYQLLHPDFTTSARVARKINEELGGKYATALDAGSVSIIPPYSYEGSPVDLVAQLEAIDVEADTPARVVVNPRTGTVVLGSHVKVMPVAIAHRNLRIEIKDGPRQTASSPASGLAAAAPGPTEIAGSGLPARGGAPPEMPGSAAEAPAPLPPPTVGLASVGTTADKRYRNVFLMDRGASIGDIVASLNEMGATSDDLVSLIQTLKASGALVADVEIQQ